jgi:ATP phosphoribosyltransferase regulatory subunit
MRDLLPEETRRRRALAHRVLDHFALHGYELVTPPAFELAEVLERGLGALDPSDVLRFVEPESGEVAALQPDMTPQIARMVATRLGREERPIRLCYEGTIVRRRQGRARRHRQVAQAGVELYGAPGMAGDLEVLELCASVVEILGLADAVIDVGHASIARALLEPLPAALAGEVTAALEEKDGARIERLLGGSRAAHVLAALCDLHGGGPGDTPGEALFDRAAPLLAGTGAEAPLGELRSLWISARAAPELASRVRLDLGEVRGFAYYTGVIFHVLARGPGEPIGAGGRYDDLLARFDAPMPAVGFALHLDSVAWAREAHGVSDDAPPRVVVAWSAGSHEAARRAVVALRACDVAAIVHPEDSAASYASAWRFSHLCTPVGSDFEVRLLSARAEQGDAGPTRVTDLEALARAITRR